MRAKDVLGAGEPGQVVEDGQQVVAVGLRGMRAEEQVTLVAGAHQTLPVTGAMQRPGNPWR